MKNLSRAQLAYRREALAAVPCCALAAVLLLLWLLWLSMGAKITAFLGNSIGIVADFVTVFWVLIAVFVVAGAVGLGVFVIGIIGWQWPIGGLWTTRIFKVVGLIGFIVGFLFMSTLIEFPSIVGAFGGFVIMVIAALVFLLPAAVMEATLDWDASRPPEATPGSAAHF